MRRCGSTRQRLSSCVPPVNQTPLLDIPSSAATSPSSRPLSCTGIAAFGANRTLSTLIALCPQPLHLQSSHICRLELDRASAWAPIRVDGGYPRPCPPD